MGFDFLPGRSLVRVDSVRASMQMGEPFPGVWLPRAIDGRGAFTLRTAPTPFKHDLAYLNYRQADEGEASMRCSVAALALSIVLARLRTRRNPPQPRPSSTSACTAITPRPMPRSSASRESRTGTPFSPALIADVEERLQQSGRFRSIEIRKRSQSIEDASAILLIIVVEEHAGVSDENPKPGVLRRLKAGTMWLPVLTAEDGYGLTHGARVSLVDALGRQTRLSVPLTWGGERRASVEVERRFAHGLLTRITADGITRREHPALGASDRRTGRRASAHCHRGSGSGPMRVSRTCGSAPWTTSPNRGCGGDARHEARSRVPAQCRVCISDCRAPVVRALGRHPRVLADVRGYVGLVRQVVFVARLQQAWSADALPPFEQLLLGGTASLRGFRLGYRMGDRLVAGSAECGCRLPHPFGSRASASHCLPTRARYGADERLADTRWDRSVGAGFFINAPVVSMRLDVAHGLDAGTRAHFTLGLAF